MEDDGKPDLGHANHDKIDIGHVYRSFRKSGSRSKVYFHIWDIKPKEASASEISGATNLDIRDVIGALEGDRRKYKKEDSLVGMGIATRREETIHEESFVLYSAKPLKFDIREALADYVKQVSPIRILQFEIEKIIGKIKNPQNKK
jgi:predicted transcriptional regulator with HTH domain